MKPCPCGEVPRHLCIEADHERAKWMRVSGSCCAMWSVEFRSGYNTASSDECMKLAIEAWEEAPRAVA